VELRPGTAVDREERHKAMISYRLGDILVPALPEREALLGVMTEFAAAITENRPALTDGRSGLRVVGLLEAAAASIAAGGRTIQLNENEGAVR